jgi:carbon monoxide dehydrogenase subunit G
MKLSDEVIIPVPRQRVWEALNDPEVLRQAIPGCEEIVKKSDTEMEAKVTVKMGPVKASFKGAVTLSDLDPPHGYRISGEGKSMMGGAVGGANVRLEEVPERNTVRAVATGAVGLSSGALPGRTDVDETTVRAAHPTATDIRSSGRYWVVRRADADIEVLDRFGDTVTVVGGEITTDATLAEAVERNTRHRGPVLLKPSIWIIDDRRLIEFSASDAATNPYAGRDDVTYLVGRSR